MKLLMNSLSYFLPLLIIGCICCIFSILVPLFILGIEEGSVRNRYFLTLGGNILCLGVFMEFEYSVVFIRMSVLQFTAIFEESS